jgi:hypothetical protein
VVVAKSGTLIVAEVGGCGGTNYFPGLAALTVNPANPNNGRCSGAAVKPTRAGQSRFSRPSLIRSMTSAKRETQHGGRHRTDSGRCTVGACFSIERTSSEHGPVVDDFKGDPTPEVGVKLSPEKPPFSSC